MRIDGRATPVARISVKMPSELLVSIASDRMPGPPGPPGPEGPPGPPGEGSTIPDSGWADCLLGAAVAHGTGAMGPGLRSRQIGNIVYVVGNVTVVSPSNSISVGGTNRPSTSPVIGNGMQAMGARYMGLGAAQPTVTVPIVVNSSGAMTLNLPQNLGLTPAAGDFVSFSLWYPAN